MSTLLELYDEQLRAAAEVSDAPELTRIGPLWAATFPLRRRGFLSYSRIGPGEDLAGLVSAAVDHYEADERVDRFEWKTRGHDALPELPQLLTAHGFTLEEQETVMAGNVSAAITAGAPLPLGYRMERCCDEATLREAEALAGRVFEDSPEDSRRMADELVARRREAPDSFEMWLVRSPQGQVVCSGRVDFVADSDFAGLWGGACDEDHRARGLYRALTAQRARWARRQGKSFLHSDCTEFSRPILQRAGLQSITTTTPAVWRRG